MAGYGENWTPNSPNDPNQDIWGGISSLGSGAPYSNASDPSAGNGAMGGGGKFDIGSLLSMFSGGNQPGAQGGWLNKGLGIAKGIADLGGLYLGIKQLGLAKDQFKFSKQAYKTNLANQTQSYNTQISDRIAGRSYNTEEERRAALAAAQLPTGG